VSCKTVKTQVELDAALADGDVTCVHIESEKGVWLSVGAYDSATVRASGSATVRASGSATVRAYDSATVRAYDSATVRAYDSATVRAYDSATVRASGSATVRASGSATVRAYDSATVEASGSATVRAYDSATVRAYDSATVRAYDSATVRASGSATVEAYDSATVEAYGSATVEAYGSATVEAYGSATVRASGSATVRASGAMAITVPRYSRAKVTAGLHVAVHLHSGAATVTGGVLIDLTQVDLKQAAAWCEHNGVEVADGRAVLYKALGDDLTAGGDYGSPVVYEVGAELVCADWLDSNECGGGLHLSPRPFQAARYRGGATRFLRCTVALEDVRPILDSTPKCKVRALRVESEVDRFGRPLPVPEPVGA
jgi:hypothetical protein